MYEGLQYVSKYGIYGDYDYPQFSYGQYSCRKDESKSTHMKGIGYIENDGRRNDELRQLVAQNPVSAAMKTVGSMASYRSGIVTEDWLHFQ